MGGDLLERKGKTKKIWGTYRPNKNTPVELTLVTGQRVIGYYVGYMDLVDSYILSSDFRNNKNYQVHRKSVKSGRMLKR